MGREHQRRSPPDPLISPPRGLRWPNPFTEEGADPSGVDLSLVLPPSRRSRGQPDIGTRPSGSMLMGCSVVRATERDGPEAAVGATQTTPAPASPSSTTTSTAPTSPTATSASSAKTSTTSTATATALPVKRSPSSQPVGADRVYLNWKSAVWFTPSPRSRLRVRQPRQVFGVFQLYW